MFKRLLGITEKVVDAEVIEDDIPAWVTADCTQCFYSRDITHLDRAPHKVYCKKHDSCYANTRACSGFKSRN